MSVSDEHLRTVGAVFSRMYDDRDLDAIRSLYRNDAVFVSPNPPTLAPGFGNTLEGADEILRFFEATMDLIPAGRIETEGLLTGIDMVVWVWRAGSRRGADVIMVDSDGLIVRQHVTVPQPD